MGQKMQYVPLHTQSGLTQSPDDPHEHRYAGHAGLLESPPPPPASHPPSPPPASPPGTCASLCTWPGEGTSQIKGEGERRERVRVSGEGEG